MLPQRPRAKLHSAPFLLVPLTSRLLYASEVDVDEVARDFTASIGYRDDGPNLWRLAAAFIAYLADLPEFATGAMHELLSLEGSAVALVRRLGEPVAAVMAG